ncbi:unnamed protein product, partial [Iphiclides podalirius]
MQMLESRVPNLGADPPLIYETSIPLADVSSPRFIPGRGLGRVLATRGRPPRTLYAEGRAARHGIHQLVGKSARVPIT